jgi:ATP phosphoribosyltransferase
MSRPLTLALPSKGRLRETAEAMFARAGFEIVRTGSARGYRGEVRGLAGMDVAFLSASEIAQSLRDGTVDLGVTGEDLLRETIAPSEPVADVLLRLGFGPADVVVAVPESWLDVAFVSDLDQVAAEFYETHGRRLRVATKYLALTRRFFAENGVTGYRIVESLGATEGAPASGSAEIIVDITTTGSTLTANRLKILDDGLILRSEAVLAARNDVKSLAVVDNLKQRLELAI